MSKSMSSPTARILRSSRLFTLPPPLPAPSIESAALGSRIRTSDTATHPYPTRQAITSPRSSRAQGDWGLKRSLPDKISTRKSPIVRINAMDTFEQITDFDSATDHVQTLKKFLEMRIPLVQPAKKLSNGSSSNPLGSSAFHEVFDNTVIKIKGDVPGTTKSADIRDTTSRVDRALLTREAMELQDQTSPLLTDNSRSSLNPQYRVRWRMNGPYLLDLSQAEFEKFLEREVQTPEVRADFKRYLLVLRGRKKREEAKAALMQEQGFDENNPEDIAKLEEAAAITDPEAEVTEFIISLRDNNKNLSSPLSRLLQEFFDLPGIPGSKKMTTETSEAVESWTGVNVHQELVMGPPSTHPSAGLSYLRSTAYMANHPTEGPQNVRVAMPARVLQPKDTAFGTVPRAMVGVGGFTVSDITIGNNYKTSDRSGADAQTMRWDFDQPGGNKIWVAPTRAHVDEKGRVIIKYDYPDEETVAVTLGKKREDRPPYEVADDDNSINGQIKKSINAQGGYGSNSASAARFRGRTVARAAELAPNQIRSFRQAMKQHQASGSKTPSEAMLAAIGQPE